MVLILAVLAPIQSLDSICVRTLACVSEPRRIFIRKYVLGPALRVAAVGAAYVLGGSSETLAYAYLASGIAGLAFCLHVTLRELRVHGVLPLPLRQWRVPWRPLLGFSLPLISTDVVSITLTGVTTVALMSAGGESAVAGMRAVVPAAELNLLVLQSFTLLFMPGATRALSCDGRAGLAEHHWQSAAWVMVLSFPLFALTFAMAPAVVPLVFGAAYADSAILLAILAVGHYAEVLLSFNAQTLQVLNHTRAIFWTNLLMAGLGVGLALALCPTLGALGAVIAITTARTGGALARHVCLVSSGVLGATPSGQQLIWFKISLVSVLVALLGWWWQPHLLLQLVLIGLLSLGLLRSTARSLDVTRSFPEIKRLPLVARVVGA